MPAKQQAIIKWQFPITYFATDLSQISFNFNVCWLAVVCIIQINSFEYKIYIDIHRQTSKVVDGHGWNAGKIQNRQKLNWLVR